MVFKGQQIRKSSALIYSPLGDELLIYDPVSGSVHVLNKTAHQVWKWLDAETPVEEMPARLSRSFTGVTEEKAEQDVQRILQSFIDSGVLIQGTNHEHLSLLSTHSEEKINGKSVEPVSPASHL